MKTRIAGLCQLMALTLLVGCCFSSLASAQETDEKVTPRFAVLPQKPLAPGTPEPDVSLLTWNGSFTYNGTPVQLCHGRQQSDHRPIRDHHDIHNSREDRAQWGQRPSFDPFSGGPLVQLP